MATGRPDGRRFLVPAVAAALAALAGASPAPAAAQGVSTGVATGSGLQRPVLMPGLRASALYSDNVLLAPDGQEDGDTILEVSPSITASSSSPRAKYDLFYQMRNFYQVDERESTLARHTLNGSGTFALGSSDRLWLDVAGFMGTLNASAEGPIAVDPGASFVNVAKVRRFSVSPWFRDRLGSFSTYQLRYYAAHAGGDNDFALAKLDQRASASMEGLARGASPWNWRAYGEVQRRDFDGDISRDRHQAGLTMYYRLNQELRVFGSLDYEHIERVFDRDGEDSGYGPGAGFDWTPNARTTVGASVSKRYYGTVSSARVAYRTARSTSGLQYSRSILTGSDASLLLYDPQAITSGQLEGVNPILGSLIATGLVLPLDPTLTQSLVTDAAVLDRRVTAFYGLYGARNSLTVALFASNRESTAELGATGGGTGIVGPSPAGGVFIGELRERGLAATYQYRIDPRSTVNLTFDRRTNSSPTASFDTRLSSVRAGYSVLLTRDTTAFAGVRRSRQTANGIDAAYDENAVYGGFDMRFR